MDGVDFVLSNEMIDVQYNDSIVKTLSCLFQELIDLNNKYSFNSSRDYFKNRKAKNIYESIDKALLNRFGIRFKHIVVEYTGYAIYTAPPANLNILKEYSKLFYDNVVDFFESKKVESKDVKTVDDITDDEYDFYDRLFRWKEGVKALEKTLESDGVNIDLNKAKISGLPKEYVLFLLADPHTLINVFKLTAIEIASVLLHEVGHGFTHLEYSYRTIRTTSVLVDTIHKNIVMKNKSYNDTLKLIYEDALNGDSKDIEGKNTSLALIKVIDKYISITLNMNETTHSYTDSEQLADQFSGKFGLSKELAVSLVKFGKYTKNLSPLTVVSGAMLQVIFITIMFLIFTGGGLMVSVAGTASFYLFSTIAKVISSYCNDGGSNDPKTYDNDRRRVIRSKNEMIRQLRSSKIDNKAKASILNNIDDITNIIDKLPDPDKSIGFIDKFIRSVSTSAKKNVRLKETEQVIEDLMANDLYVSSLKLKQKIGEI